MMDPEYLARVLDSPSRRCQYPTPQAKKDLLTLSRTAYVSTSCNPDDIEDLDALEFIADLRGLAPKRTALKHVRDPGIATTSRMHSFIQRL